MTTTQPNYKISIVTKLDKLLTRKMEDLNNRSSDLCYKEKTPEEIQENFDKFCSADDIVQWVLATEANDIIGRVAIFKREIMIGQKSVILGGIGKVKVRDDKRRQGVAKAMMLRAMTLFPKLNCELVYLCTNINNPIMVSFYNKFGFELFVLGCDYVGKSGKKYHESGAMFASGDPDVFSSIMNLEAPVYIGCGNW